MKNSLNVLSLKLCWQFDDWLLKLYRILIKHTMCMFFTVYLFTEMIEESEVWWFPFIRCPQFLTESFVWSYVFFSFRLLYMYRIPTHWLYSKLSSLIYDSPPFNCYYILINTVEEISCFIQSLGASCLSFVNTTRKCKYTFINLFRFKLTRKF